MSTGRNEQNNSSKELILHTGSKLVGQSKVKLEVLGSIQKESVRQRIIGFFLRHPKFFIDLTSRYYPLSEVLLEGYKDQWNWENLNDNSGLPWSEALFDKYYFRWWHLPKIWNKERRELQNEKCDNKWRGSEKSGYEDLPWSESLMNKYIDKWGWEKLSWNTSLPWCDSILERYCDKWDWVALSSNNSLPWSEHLIDKYAEKWYWGYERLNCDNNLPWYELEKFVYSGGGLSGNKCLPWSDLLIEKYADKWDWGYLSGYPIELFPGGEYFIRNESVWEKAFKPYLDDAMIEEIFKRLDTRPTTIEVDDLPF